MSMHVSSNNALPLRKALGELSNSSRVNYSFNNKNEKINTPEPKKKQWKDIDWDRPPPLEASAGKTWKEQELEKAQDDELRIKNIVDLLLYRSPKHLREFNHFDSRSDNDVHSDDYGEDLLYSESSDAGSLDTTLNSDRTVSDILAEFDKRLEGYLPVDFELIDECK
eukprot:CAMPEP_0175045438 /NCGR_PEP_ID=MMETSP0052_2-20121109/4422_1 /TAXON_ID=51329 ORGANISM="Polytomella parva, Strain SAG 63-3" /NCGR_SAMPLE_ID=MMETSP0052_2 /ASSEMBLY_ACC=CAM_ASM_000194 /LENGTH=166 /DNA_ID=CAMNT_0016308967 /DNA_START=10 /DNA_END=510 /DNA_ORIENTATION=+